MSNCWSNNSTAPSPHDCHLDTSNLFNRQGEATKKKTDYFKHEAGWDLMERW